LARQRATRLAALGQLGPLIQGSLTRREVRCGNASCRCARGQRHVSYHLTRKVKNRTQSVYVPVDMIEEVRRWVSAFRHAKTLLREVSALSEQLLRCHVAARRAGRARSASRPSRRASPR
jgi:hypothetical protein